MTPDLFQHAAERRDLGMERAATKAGDDWTEYAKAFVRDYLRTHTTMFCDDLWTAGMVRPSSPRGLGQIMRHAQLAGWCSLQVDRQGCILAKRSTSSNLTLKPVWRSHLYEERRKV